MEKEPFFSLASLKQPVNQWIVIAVLCLWGFWMVLYYLGDTTFNIGNHFVSLEQGAAAQSVLTQ